MTSYYAQLVIDLSLTGILAVGLGIVYGHTGVLSLCHATFLGVGAYTAATLGTMITLPGIPPIVSALILGLVGGAIAASVVGAASIPLRGDFVALATLAFGELLWTLLINSDQLGGANGLRNIPRLTTPWIAVVTAIVVIIAARIWLRGRCGRLSEAVRDDRQWAQALGVSPNRIRFSSFVIGGAFAGLAGALYAHSQQYINPDSFGLMPSITVLLAVILGGRGNLTGCVIGATFVFLLPEFLREADVWRPMAMGLLLLATSARFPNGFLGKRPYWDPIRRFPLRRVKPSVERQSVVNIILPTRPVHDNPVMLLIEGLTVRTEKTTILNNIRLSVEGGRPLAIVGPNGSGKSTLAKALSGTIPAEGTFSMCDVTFALFPRHNKNRSSIICLPQHPRGFRRMSASDNICIAFDRLNSLPVSFVAARGRSRPYPYFDDEIMAALASVGLTHKADAMLETLSYGQRKRVMLATALLADPDVLILDEPFAGLNAGMGSEAEIITSALGCRLTAPDRITIVIDHRLALIEPICPRLALLDTGTIIAEDDLSRLVKTERFQDIYERSNPRH
jgi:branched-chain amino acid transport system permease protein